MSYTLITEDLIVGSQPQNAEDIDHLKEEQNVAYILNLQQDKDVEYWGIDLPSIVKRCKELGIHHMRRPVSNYLPFAYCKIQNQDAGTMWNCVTLTFFEISLWYIFHLLGIIQELIFMPNILSLIVACLLVQLPPCTCLSEKIVCFNINSVNLWMSSFSFSHGLSTILVNNLGVSFETLLVTHLVMPLFFQFVPKFLGSDLSTNFNHYFTNHLFKLGQHDVIFLLLSSAKSHASLNIPLNISTWCISG